jgi:Flp pilus assembly protein TadD
LVAALMSAAPVGQATAASPQPLNDAAHAIDAERLDQAQILIAQAIQTGARGPAVERLIADLAFAKADYALALGRYQLLLARSSSDAVLLERAGISALHVRDSGNAKRYLELAVEQPGASWRAWNARAALADRLADWDSADVAYSRAAELAPHRPEIANNIGWSYLIRGRWSDAVAFLERARKLDPASRRISDNLELARAAIGENLPQRGAGESDMDFAARLNDAGVVAQLQGQRGKAIAAFARAVAARSHWFDRAANNLQRAEAQE